MVNCEFANKGVCQSEGLPSDDDDDDDDDAVKMMMMMMMMMMVMKMMITVLMVPYPGLSPAGCQRAGSKEGNTKWDKGVLSIAEKRLCFAIGNQSPDLILGSSRF